MVVRCIRLLALSLLLVPSLCAAGGGVVYVEDGLLNDHGSLVKDWARGARIARLSEFQPTGSETSVTFITTEANAGTAERLHAKFLPGWKASAEGLVTSSGNEALSLALLICETADAAISTRNAPSRLAATAPQAAPSDAQGGYLARRANPFRRFNDNTDFYGSGDVNGDSRVDSRDLSSDNVNEMADVDGNGVVDARDRTALAGSLSGDEPKLPDWERASRTEKEQWLLKMLALDKTDQHAYTSPKWVCLHFAAQVYLNFGGYHSALPAIYSDPQWSTPNRFNLPVYSVSVSAPNFGHAINAMLVGDNPLEFSHWRFFEPQNDTKVTPGAWNMPKGATLSVYAIKEFIGDSAAHTVMTLVRFKISDQGLPALDWYGGTPQASTGGPNQPPVPADDTAAVAIDSAANTIDVLLNDQDADGDPLAIEQVTEPANGVATVVDNRIEYTPNPGYVGVDTMRYTVSDGRGATGTATLTVYISNHAPIAMDDTVMVMKNTTDNIIDVLGNDSDPDRETLTLVSVAAPANGAVAVVAGHIQYTPNPDYVGEDSFRYTVCDESEASSEANVTVTVTDLPDPPQAADDATGAPAIREVGVIQGTGSAMVYVVDTDAVEDVSLADIHVKFAKRNVISSIVLTGKQAMGGLGIVVSGAASVKSFKDSRKGPLGDIAFFASTAPVGSIKLKGRLAGYNLNGLVLGGVAFGSDLDGDGDTGDATGLWTPGKIDKVTLRGDVAGDIVAGQLGSLSVTRARLLADVRVFRDLASLKMSGYRGTEKHVAVGSVSVGGRIAKLNIKGGDATGALTAGSIGEARYYGEMAGEVTAIGRCNKLYTLGGLTGNVTAGGGLGLLYCRGEISGNVTVIGNLDRLDIPKKARPGIEQHVHVTGRICRIIAKR